MRGKLRLWLRYLRERRGVFLLYILTAFLFLAVGGLSHIEDFQKLLYAFLLTTVIWAVVGIVDGRRHVRRSAEAEVILKQLEKGEELPEAFLKWEEWEENTTENDWRQICSMLCDARVRDRMLQEERAAERMDYFLMWTHQIKTPISAMRLLADDNFQMREELFKVEQYVEMVLSYQRLEDMSQDMVLQEYMLSSLLKQAIKKYSILFINKHIQFELGEADCRVVTDEKWFSFCVEQILSNSIKYAEKGKISVSCIDGEERVQLKVADTGIGIRAEDLPRIFEKGFTGYNGRIDKRATGIGLYLCKRICEKLGIELRIESEQGVGTTVFFYVPKKR